MPVSSAPTPNPNALKFSVGRPVGDPRTYVAGSEPEEAFAADLVRISGVTSIFLTADFVTVTKSPDASWDTISPEATAILEREFAG